jgi:hypothetical protein
MMWFGQEIFTLSQSEGSLDDQAYTDAPASATAGG